MVGRDYSRRITIAAVISRFGGFVLDYPARQLLHDGVEIHLSPKAFELLAILVADRARALDKSELLTRLWPSTFVEETNLASLVAELRRALRDSATDPVFIKTVHRFGYRFVAEVTERDVAPPAVRPRPRVIVGQREFLLMDGANVIGRAPDATIPCAGAGVSRHHARIVISQDGATLHDMDSKNGTYVRDERIVSAPLSDGDEIRLGDVVLTFRDSAAGEPTETLPPDPRASRRP
jgi:DNA-binding winged helix-turn-helix (wHTH) protein